VRRAAPARLGPAALAFTLGLAHAAAFSPLAHWAYALAVLAALFALLRAGAARGATPTGQAGLAFAFGMGWFGAGLAWLYVSMHVYGGMPAPMAAAAVVLFAAYLSVYPATAVGLAARACAGRGPIVHALGLTGAFTLAELSRGLLFTGFPWLAVGYAQLDGPLDRLAPVVGVFGVGAAAVGAAALAAVALVRDVGQPVGTTRRARVAAAALAVAILALPLALPRDAWTRAVGAPLDVRLVQGNVPQDMKFRPERTLSAMRDYTERFESGRATLTVLPETAWTVPWERTPAPIAERILAHVARGHAIAIGLPAILVPPGGGDPRLANSVLLLQSGASGAPRIPAPRYDKRHLVPFGEFVPWGFRWFVDMMHIPLGDFARGGAGQPPFEVGDQRIAFNVCYEDLFGEELREALLGERGATVLANVSNIAWFGRSHALPQHLAIARMRTLETGRPMLRATNTGVTAAIDAQGRVIARLDDHVAGELDVRVQGTTGLTPFARAGNAPAWAGALLLLAATALASRAGRAHRTR
jgi:apolipoprotein N-acyltransferase